MTSVIFDIDGTLLESFRFDDEFYNSALRDVLGDVYIRDDWTTYNKITQTGVLREVLAENRLQDTNQFEKVRHRYGEYIQQHIKGSDGWPPRPGAISLIQNLSATRDINIGIATGGWHHTAIMKLEAAGFTLNNIVLASSDDSDDR
ncbi:MAG: HAD family hydrolase, partial [Pseudomonadota bacterium]